MIYFGKVDGSGKLQLENRDILKKEISHHRNKTLKFSVSVCQGPASKGWHGYYRGIMLHVVKDELYKQGIDLSLKDIHNYLAKKFLSYHIDIFDEDVVQSTADLDNQQWMDYTRKIKEWMLENFHIHIDDYYF
jgi:hypothetical protein